MSSVKIPDCILEALRDVPLRDKILEFISDQRYFGSDLNHYIHLFHPNLFTLNNNDLFFHCRNTGKVFIGEVKHQVEKLPQSQEDALRKIASGQKPDVYILRGDFPLDHDRRQEILEENEQIIAITRMSAKSEEDETSHMTLHQFDEWLCIQYGGTVEKQEKWVARTYPQPEEPTFASKIW